jgi:hypothetical protein
MNKECEEFYQTIKNATLEVVSDAPNAKVFLLRNEPHSYMMSTILIFAAGHTIITGDLSVSDNGVVSCAGYGIGWFTQHHDPSYLAEKFLHKKWVKEKAIEYWKEFGALRDEENPDEPKYIWRFYGANTEPETIGAAMVRFAEENEDAFDSAGHLYDNLPSAWINEKWRHPFDITEFPSRWYDPIEVGWLCAIQRRFAECYMVKAEEK